MGAKFINGERLFIERFLVFEEEASVRLVDWKTGITAEADDQLVFYALLWTLANGDIPATVEAVSVKTGERQPRHPDIAELQALADRIAAMVISLRTSWAENRALDRVGGPWCPYCPLLDGCSEGRAATAVMASG